MSQPKADKIECKANWLLRMDGKEYKAGETVHVTPAFYQQHNGGVVSPIEHHSDDATAGPASGQSGPDATGSKTSGDGQTLIGSNKLPAVIDLSGDGEVTAQLGEVVQEAFERSGLTIEQWNKLGGDDIEKRLQVVVDDWTHEAKSDGPTDEERGQRDRIRSVVDAIGKLGRAKKNWNDNGQPDLTKLRRAAGDETITDAERDQAWALIQRERNGQ